MVNVKSYTIFNLFAVLLLSTGAMVAQTSKPTPKPMATPPVLTGAEIISRAADYENAINPQVKTVEKPVEGSSTPESEIIKELNERIKRLEASQKVDKDEKQKRLLLNLDILTRAEQRTESLRKQMFEMIEKENSVKSRLDQLEIEIRPDMIERALQLNGSMRPEEVREGKRRSIMAERTNLQALLTEIQNTRSNLSVNLQKADSVVEKLRAKLEKDIDDSLIEDPDK